MQIPLFKVTFAGDHAVGKTSLINQYCASKMTGPQINTSRLDFQLKQVTLPEGRVQLSFWEPPVLDSVAIIRSSFYRGAQTCALVFDVTRPDTLADLIKWREEILNIAPEILFVVVGNKIDLLKVEDDSTAMEFALSIQANFIHTSAITGDGVDFLFETLARKSMRVTGYQ
jgi:small GTP-binding protein